MNRDLRRRSHPGSSLLRRAWALLWHREPLPRTQLEIRLPPVDLVTLKQYRRIATRYEKRATNYLAMVTLGMTMLCLT